MTDDLHPLGRLVQHDPLSKNFPLTLAMRSVPVASVLWPRHRPIFDQGNVGACTGYAAASAMATGMWNYEMNNAIALHIYERATMLDGFPGTYPPVDTGSSGLAAMKALRERRLIRGFRHAFSVGDVIAALQFTPIITGIWWYEGFDRPAADGLVRIAGGIRGGHEVCLVGADLERRRIRAVQSWGRSWGDHGYFDWDLDEYAALLADRGDATIPVPAPKMAG